MNIYRIITLCQYLYNAPLLGSASTQEKKEMERQQHRFFNIIGITSARALEVYKIEPIATLTINMLKQKHTRTAAYKKHYELKEMDVLIKSQIQEKQKQQLQNISQ